MNRSFHVYECVACGAKEMYPLKADALFGSRLECTNCKAPLREVGTREGVLTLHPITGHFCIEEDLKYLENVKKEN